MPDVPSVTKATLYFSIMIVSCYEWLYRLCQKLNGQQYL
jgi:hypothetical protein